MKKITTKVLLGILCLLVVVAGIICELGGFTGYTEKAVLQFIEVGDGEYLQVPHHDYPIEKTEHFRWPWQEEIARYYIPPPLPEEGGIYVLPEGTFIITEPIQVEGDEIFMGQGFDTVIILGSKQ